MSEQTTVATSDTPEEQRRLPQSVLNKVFWRYFWSFQISWNYERMQALGFAYAIEPALRFLYREKTKYAEALQRHLTFFNTSPIVGGPLILGTSTAMEEAGATTSAESVKVAMMGPLAGVGDSLTFVVYNSIIFVLGATWAEQGSVIGPIFAGLMVLVPYFLVRRWQFNFGYKQGKTLVTRLATGALERFSEGLIILGMIVLGGFIPSKIGLFANFAYTIPAVPGVKGSKPTVEHVQAQLDQIVPYLLPVLLAGLVYFLIKRFRLNPIWCIAIVFVLGIVLGGIGMLVGHVDWFVNTSPVPATTS